VVHAVPVVDETEYAEAAVLAREVGDRHEADAGLLAAVGAGGQGAAGAHGLDILVYDLLDAGNPHLISPFAGSGAGDAPWAPSAYNAHHTIPERRRPSLKTSREWALDFLKALEGTPELRAQARLLNTADRDIAAVLFQLEEGEREPVYMSVGQVKAEKIRSELARMRHVRLGPETVGRIAEHLVRHLSADKPLGPVSRYFRPRKAE
jgi:hypothetical protein